MSNIKPEDLLLLLDRPQEPLVLPKGDGKILIDAPAEYTPARLRPEKTSLTNRFGGGERIEVRKLSSIPDLSFARQLEKRDQFSLFIPKHRNIAARLIEVFMGARDASDLMSIASSIRDDINPLLFHYALSVALLHRKDTKHLPLRSLASAFPEKFMDGSVFPRAREEVDVFEQEEEREPIEIPLDYTATDLEIEHRVAYFREDLGVNLHHWHWHLVYPNVGPREIVNKDRRGELFFYMHQQIVARYNFERFCNNLGRVQRLVDWNEPIEEGYFPKLDTLISSRVWAPRFSNVKLQDISRDVQELRFDINTLQRWRDNIYSAIHTGTAVDGSGKPVTLSESRGIDILGNMIESSDLSVNKALYGDLHNFGHLLIAYCHDPDHRHLETFSVMGDSATAMRDPVFYRWHAFIDDLFQEHKSTIPRYEVSKLDYPGVKVASIEVQTAGKTKNELSTFWEKSDFNFTRGFDFSPRGAVLARFTHLQHEPFTYKIMVENTNKKNVLGTVRIFMSPKFDERGVTMNLRDQKNLMVELDRFVVNIPPGKNPITRESSQSNVTIPYSRTFRDLDANRPADQTREALAFDICGCGWPHHMLIPRGTAAGFPCELFIMISNFDDDRVQSGLQSNQCSDASSYCGIRDSVYPDKRSMGYPFDRQIRRGVDTLKQFLTPNMKTTDVSIKFSNRTSIRRSGMGN